MEDNKVLQLVYTFFVGILIAFFVGIGINTFYTPPVQPKYPTELNISTGKEPTPEQVKLQENFEKQMQTFNDEQMNPYNRNVSIMTLGAAVILLALSIVFEKKIRVIADGVMLGGLFTLFYSLGRGLASQNSKYVFAMVSVGLAIVLFLGYHRFVKDPSSTAKSKK